METRQEIEGTAEGYDENGNDFRGLWNISDEGGILLISESIVFMR